MDRADDKLHEGSSNGTGALVLRPEGEQAAISFVRFEPRAPYDSRLLFLQGGGTETAAAFRVLRQRLIDRGNPRTILCTSAGRREGKTMLAANLAMAYAELSKHRVLLVEANFRVAALGEMFGFLPPKGFASQLDAHRVRPRDPWVVVQIAGAPLFILAAEPRACSSCARVLAENARFCPMCGAAVAVQTGPTKLDGNSFSAMIQSFRESFDYVIIDAPAVLGSGDVNLIQDVADAVVFSTRKGKTEARNLRRAIEQVAPAPVAAVALMED